MIRIAVCDDEPFMLENIAAHLAEYAEEARLKLQISNFADGQTLLNSGSGFDILFLDIQMNPLNGMETARQLREHGFCGLLIFVTILRDSVFDSFEVQAFDYLVKPLNEERFRRTMARAIEAVEQGQDKKILIQRGGAYQVIPFAQIMYCEVIGRKIYLHQQGGAVTDYYDKLENLREQVDKRFFRCHRSYLVNLDYVRGYHAGLVTLSDGSEIPVSRLRGPELIQTLLAHMKERRR